MQATPIEQCCSPLLGAALSEHEAADLAGAFKVISDPVRLRLLSLIANAAEGEACACEFVDALERSQPTISHHLSVLVDAGLVTREKRGRWAYYRAVPDRLQVLRAALGPS